MKVIKVQSIHFDADQSLLDLVDQKLAKLDQFFDHIIDAEVYLRLDQEKRAVKDKIAEFKLNIPGHSLFSRATNLDFEIAVEEAYDNMARQLKKQKEKYKV